MSYLKLTLENIVETEPIEINGLLLDAEATFHMRKDDDDIMIHDSEIGDLYVVGDDGNNFALRASGAAYGRLFAKFEAACNARAMKLAKAVSAYRWTLVETDDESAA